MWKCDKCGQELEKRNQEHPCNENLKTIDSYIKGQPDNVQPLLNQVRETIRGVLPGAEERISWNMPTYWNKHNIIHFAAFKNHMGLYPGANAIEYFKVKLTDYKTSKGAVQFPYNKPIPLELIAEITMWCNETGNHH